MVHEFDPIIYPFKIWVTVSSNLTEVTDMFFDGETNEEFAFIRTDNYEAMTLPVIKKDNRKIGIVICFKSKQYMKVKQIAHESCHAAKYLFEHIGADIEPHEPFEYVVGFIADCCENVRKYVTIQEPVKRITKTRNIGMTIKPQVKDIHTNNLIAVICFDWADFDDYIRSLCPKQIFQGLHDTYIIDKYTYQAVYEIHHPRGNEYIYIEEAERAKENPNYAKIKECTIAGLTKKK